MTINYALFADQLETILFKADPTQTEFYGASNASDVLGVLVEAADAQRPQRLTAFKPDCWDLENEQIKMLARLYARLDTPSKEALLNLILLSTGQGSPYRKYSGYLFTFLARYYNFSTALDSVVNTLAVDESSHCALLCVSSFLKYDSSVPTDQELTELQAKVKRQWDALRNPSSFSGMGILITYSESAQALYEVMQTTVTRIVEQSREIKYSRLRKDLFSDTNSEVNQDRRVLVTELGRLGFPEKLVESLEYAESEYSKAENEFDFKTSADHNRSFFDALLWEIANKAAMLRRETLGAHQKRAHEVRDYLKSVGFLSDRLQKLCEAFYQFASEQSTHRLSSGREVARIVRNMNIELGLLLMRHFESFAAEYQAKQLQP